MSASPPPPPSPSGTPPPPMAGAPAAWSRRASRDQRRAAALAARQQRDLIRLQMRAQRRGSLVGPTMVVAIGLTFLLIELGKVRSYAVVLWMSRWWPTLLLSAGLILLAEWAADTWVAGSRRTNLPRRTLGPGAVLLLVLLVTAGLFATGLNRNSDWIQQNWGSNLAETWGLDQIFGQESETDQDFAAPLRAGAPLTIHNYRGNIHVTGASPDGLVHVSVHQHLVTWRGDDLGSHKHRNAPVLQRDGDGLQLNVAGDGRDRADLTIQVPHEAALVLTPEKGDIDIAEIRGPVTVQEHIGGITLTGITGSVHLSSNDDDAIINGHSLSGGLTLEGRSGDLGFSDVTGPLTLQGDFFGTSHLEHIHGPVRFRSSFTDLACAGIPGQLNVDGRSDLEANDLNGPVVLSTTNRNLRLSGVRGGAIITDRDGSVDLGLIGTMAGVEVSTASGSIRVHVPPKSSFTVTATTSAGKIDNDMGLRPDQHGDRTSLTGQVSHGGPQVSLQASDGDITIDQETPSGLDGLQEDRDNDAGNDRDHPKITRVRPAMTD